MSGYLEVAARRAAMMHALTTPYWRDVTNLHECERVYRAFGISAWTEQDHRHVVDTVFRLRGQKQLARAA